MIKVKGKKASFRILISDLRDKPIKSKTISISNNKNLSLNEFKELVIDSIEYYEEIKRIENGGWRNDFTK